MEDIFSDSRSYPTRKKVLDKYRKFDHQPNRQD